MGITNAKNLALSGTLFGKFYNRSLTKQELKEAKSVDLVPTEPPPDFAEELEVCFVKKMLYRYILGTLGKINKQENFYFLDY